MSNTLEVDLEAYETEEQKQLLVKVSYVREARLRKEREEFEKRHKKRRLQEQEGNLGLLNKKSFKKKSIALVPCSKIKIDLEARAGLNWYQGHEYSSPQFTCDHKERRAYHASVCGPLPREWKQGRLLGAGGFGKVYECIPLSRLWTFTDKIAVKTVKIEPQYTEMSKEDKAIRNEINILMKLRHERIVSFYGFEEKNDHLHLFMDFMAGGSLSDHIKNRKVLFESESRRYTKQILEGVSFLHAKNIIHRDIKGSNVLLDGEGNVKLADFGLSTIIQKIGSKTDLVSHCGTPHWMAPEIIRGKGYGRKADIWSVGCTVVEMLTGRPPLGHLEPVAAIFEIGSNPTVPTLPEGVSQDAKEFIQAALTPNPLERPWSEELLKHNFVSVPTDW